MNLKNRTLEFLCRITLTEKTEIELIPFMQDIPDGGIVLLSGSPGEKI